MIKELDGFVFSTFPYYTGYVDVDLDKFSRKAANVKINVYSPHPPSRERWLNLILQLPKSLPNM